MVKKEKKDSSIEESKVVKPTTKKTTNRKKTIKVEEKVQSTKTKAGEMISKIKSKLSVTKILVITYIIISLVSLPIFYLIISKQGEYINGLKNYINEIEGAYKVNVQKFAETIEGLEGEIIKEKEKNKVNVQKLDMIKTIVSE